MLFFPLWRKYEITQLMLRNEALVSSSEAYVARPQDRRQQMEILRKSLDVRWTYVNTIESEDEVVGRIMQNVRIVRQQAISALGETKCGNRARLIIWEIEAYHSGFMNLLRKYLNQYHTLGTCRHRQVFASGAKQYGLKGWRKASNMDKQTHVKSEKPQTRVLYHTLCLDPMRNRWKPNGWDTS